MVELLKPRVKIKGFVIIMEAIIKTIATTTPTTTRLAKVMPTRNLLSASGAIRVTHGSIVKERR